MICNRNIESCYAIQLHDTFFFYIRNLIRIIHVQQFKRTFILWLQNRSRLVFKRKSTIFVRLVCCNCLWFLFMQAKDIVRHLRDIQTCNVLNKCICMRCMHYYIIKVTQFVYFKQSNNILNLLLHCKSITTFPFQCTYVVRYF